MPAFDASREALERTVRKLEVAKGHLSREGRRELERSVREDPEAYIDGAPERALLVLDRSLRWIDRDQRQDDARDDEAFGKALVERMGRLVRACDEALAIDLGCLDAAVIRLIAQGTPVDARYRALRDVLAGYPEPVAPVEGDLAANVFWHPWLRAQAALARWAFSTTRHRVAVALCERSLALSPGDPYGVRHTLALTLARLEDEAALEALDKRFDRQGSAWMALARTLLLFKLNRLGPARRALAGYVSLYEGGAFALARPSYQDPYLPVRPPFAPRSFDESLLATHEAEPVVVDTPDFIGWCRQQPGFNEAEESFARRMGYDGP